MNVQKLRTAIFLCFATALASPRLQAGADSCPGLWRSLPIPGATSGIADVLMLPDGTLVVGLKTAGLRLYARTPGGSYAWQSIVVSPRAPSIASNKVTCLALFQNELWVGTEDAGISIRSLDDGSWRTVNVANSALPSNYISHLTPVKADPSIARPKSTDETLWASTSQGGALYFYFDVGAIRGWTWRIVDHTDGLLAGDFVRDIAVQFDDGARYTWFATADVLSRWDGQTFVPFSLSCSGATAERILVDDLNRVWFAPLEIVPGIGRVGDGAGGTVIYAPVGLCRLTPGRLRPTWTDFPNQYGHDMSLDPAGRLWTSGIDQFGTLSGGGWVHDQGTWCVFKQPDKPITSNQVSCVHATGELTWYGQDASAVLDSYTNNWTRLSKGQLQITDALGPVAFALNTAFVGGLRGFSYILKPPLSWHYVSLSNQPSARATAFLREVNGIWVGLDSDGLRFVTIDPASLLVQKIDAYQAADGLAGDGVQALARDKGGRLWVGTSEGLSLQGNGYWLNFRTSNSGLIDNAVRSLAVDGAGKLWIATFGSGISVLDPEAEGGPAWTSQTIADGLPSNDVRALAASPDGVIWAATAGGACEHDPDTGVWTVHNAADGSLPGDLALSLAIDSSGRVWVGTASGLAVREAGAWRHYHVTSSTLGDDVVSHVAARATELWATTENQIAVREDIIGPIGEFPPTITSFAPAAQAPGGVVIVTGTNFDDRGPGHNEVFVGVSEGLGGAFSQPSEVVSVTSTHLAFRVRDLALDGTVRVISHCLETESAATLKIAPKITSFSPSCAAVGDQITINGAGFVVAGGVEVRFGNGPWRLPVTQSGGHLEAGLIRLRLQQGDESGKIQVRRQDGTSVASSAGTLSIGHVELLSHRLQQGVEGMRLIWGKRTLVILNLHAVGCNTKVTGGKIYWKKKDGTEQRAGKAYARTSNQPIALDVTGNGVDLNADDFQGLEFVGEFESNRSGYGEFFPLSDLASIVCSVENQGVEALTVEIPASEANFREIKKKFELFSMGVFAENGSTSWGEFWSNATDSLYEVARILPQPDFGPFYGTQAWMVIKSAYITEDSADLESSLPTSDFARITASVDDLIEPGFGQFGMGLIDPKLYTNDPDGSSNPSGKAWVSPGDHDKTAVSYNFADKAAPITAQELCHMLGLVHGNAQNYDDDNAGHSLYDECDEYEDDNGKKQCGQNQYKGYSQAVEDQIGIKYPRMRQLSDGAPRRVDWSFASNDRAKSSMSYAPGKKNWNSFLEPVDHNAVLSFLSNLYQEWQDGNGGGGGLGDGGAGTTFNVRFLLTMEDEVLVTSAHLDDSGDPASVSDPDGHFGAVVRDAGGAPLVSLPFAVGFHTHNNEAAVTRLALRIPFPASGKIVELYHGDALLWSKSRSANPPSVSFTAPTGGSFSADSTVDVSWTASDPDGGALQFALDYSADGGATWIKLPQYLTSTTYSWRPGFLPKSNAARLRIRASDCFNTSTALSAPFAITPAQPLVFIRSPQDGESVPEGSLVDLVALSMTSQGFGLGTFKWQVDTLPLTGTAIGSEFTFDVTGPHVVQVSLTDPSGLQALKQITVQVFPDFDHDGLPNDWEQENGLNPLDVTDASKDPDGDGLSNFAEYHWKTDPQKADTDGDGFSDGAEVLAGTDPLNPDSKPLSAPTLHVGATHIGFTVPKGVAASELKSIWVTNPGPGNVVWSVQNDLPWLEVSPADGTAPTEVTLMAVPGGLGEGEYTGQIVFSAQGAQDSPQVLMVRLTVDHPSLDGGPRFLRGDSNGDGKMNISDASYTLTYLFIDSTKSPVCIDAADANDDGTVNITDAIYALGSLFLGGPAPPAPFPSCGTDPTADGLDCGHVASCQ